MSICPHRFQQLLLLLVATLVTVVVVTEAVDRQRDDNDDTQTKSKQTISELRDELEKNRKKIEALERNKDAVIADYRESQGEVKDIHSKLVQCQLREKDLAASEGYIKQEMGNFALEVKRVLSENRKLQQELATCRKKVDKDGQSAAANGDSKCVTKVEDDEVETLKEKILNCEETVKAIRERCGKDQSDLKQLTKDHDRLIKASGNCTEQLKDCETQKSYLEFLKKGYDLVVQDLEKEAKEATENKEQSDKDAEAAIKGASTYRTYLVAIGIVATIFFTVKFYYIAMETIRRRTAAILEAKARVKLETKKNKRK